MSMYVSVVRVTPAAFEQLEQDPSQLEAVFFNEDAAVLARLGIAESDSAGFDYLSADAMMGAMADLDEGEDEEEDADSDEDSDDGDGDDDAVYKDLGADGTLDYDAGYGPAFTLSPAAVKKAAKRSSVIELDDDVKALFEAAVMRGDYIIGIVS
jgi:hypothetical protein